MPTVDEVEDKLLDILNSGNRDRVVREIAFSRIRSGSISPELLNLVVDEESSGLDDEKKTFKSLREKSRERLE